MIKRILIVLVLFHAGNASAEDKQPDEGDFHPSRVRLLLHGALDVSETLQPRVHFIPATNLRAEITPVLFLGLGWQAWKHLNIEPVLGYHFGNESPILSLRLAPKIWRLEGWVDIEVQIPSWKGYVFANLDFKILGKYLQAGVEYESWGDYTDSSSWSHGGGPNVLLRFGMLGVDLALHIRELEERVRPEFFLRVHLFAPSVNLYDFF